MSGSSPAPLVDPLTGSLASQLDAATPILHANNWVTKPQLDHLRSKVLEAGATVPVATAGRSALAQFLLDYRLLPRDQVIDLDAIMRSQMSLPEFELQKKVGAGGMGTVFLARHLATDRLVALKTMNARLAEDKDFIERFHREARSLAAVRNQYIAEIIGTGENDGFCWLAMEYIDGPSLMKMLKEHRVLPEAYALHLTIQLAEGLGHVWEKAGLVHRDLKPENILVIRSGHGDDLFPRTDIAKLIDFGLVKSNNEDDRLTQTGMTIGTPLYMSPEQVRGEKLDCRSDIYGLGATLFHILTGTTPFTGTSPGAIMSAHLTEAVPDPGNRVPSLSKETRTLVMTAMAKGVDKRYSTFGALAQACRDALAAIEHKSASFPKLLRKPLVMKQPVRRSGEFSSEPPAPNEPASKQAPTVITPATRPHSESIRRPASGSTLRPPSASVSGSAPASSPSHPAAGTSGRSVSSRQSSPTGQLPPIAPASGRFNPAASSTSIPPPSAAYLEPLQSPGVGMMPWIVLGFAIIAVLVFIIVSYV